MHMVNSWGQPPRACCLAQHGERRLRKGEHVAQRRGVYTAPMKRGGYGYNKTTLSEIQGHKGVVRGGTGRGSHASAHVMHYIAEHLGSIFCLAAGGR